MAKQKSVDLKEILKGLKPIEKKELFQLMLQEELRLLGKNPETSTYVDELSPYMQLHLMNELLKEESRILLFDENSNPLRPNDDLNFIERKPIDDEIMDFHVMRQDGVDEGSIKAAKYVVHGHGFVNEEPKFIIFPSVMDHLNSGNPTITKTDFIDLCEGSMVMITDNYNLEATPLGTMTDDLPMLTTKSRVLLKVVKVSHNISTDEVESATEIFIASENSEIPIVLEEGTKTMYMTLCDCQNPESHDPLHIKNRKN